LVVGHATPHLVARIIKSLTDERTLLVVSTDLSHYHDAAAQRRDRATAEAIERLDFKRRRLWFQRAERRPLRREREPLGGLRCAILAK
jgi:AmmeMemoRadiSam system protein B